MPQARHWQTFLWPNDWNVRARLVRWLTLFWVLFGLVVLLSASYELGLNESGLGWAYLLRQAIWLVPGFAIYAVATRCSLRRMAGWAPIGIVVSMVLMLATLIPGIGTNVYGATRWIAIGPLLIQPSEYLKPFLVLQGAVVFTQWPRWTNQTRFSWLGIFALALGLILKQPNLSTTALCGILLWIIALASGLEWRWIVFSALGGLGAGLASISLNAYQKARVLSFLNPWKDPRGDSYQLVQSLLAIGSGGVTGRGYGQSIQKLSYLPIQHTDFIFAVYAEEFGFLGSLGLLVFLLIYLGVGLWIALRARRNLQRLVAVGSVSLLVLQSMINIAVASGGMPTTGLPLPFVSYGGNAVIVSMFVAGLLTRAALEEELPEDPPARRRAALAR